MNSTDMGIRYRSLVSEMLPTLDNLVHQLNKTFIKFIHQVNYEEDENRWIPVKDIVDLELNAVLSQLQQTEYGYKMRADTIFQKGRYRATRGELRVLETLCEIFEILARTFQKHMETLMSNIPFGHRDDRDFSRQYWKLAVRRLNSDERLHVGRAYDAMRDCKEDIAACFDKIGVVDQELDIAEEEDANQAEGNDNN